MDPHATCLRLDLRSGCRVLCPAGDAGFIRLVHRYTPTRWERILSAVSPRLLVPGSRYCWRVGAIDPAGRSTFSDSVWCATGPLPSGRPVRLPDSRRDEENTALTVIRNDNVYPVTIDSARVHPRMFVRTLLPLVIGAGDSVMVRLGYRPHAFRDELDTLRLVTEGGDHRRCVSVPGAPRRCWSPGYHRSRSVRWPSPIPLQPRSSSRTPVRSTS